MDARKYDAIRHVAVGQFDKAQRTRLEAFTAAQALLPSSATVGDKLTVAEYITGGVENVDFISSDD